jgi:hypothetical protein
MDAWKITIESSNNKININIFLTRQKLDFFAEFLVEHIKDIGKQYKLRMTPTKNQALDIYVFISKEALKKGILKGKKSKNLKKDSRHKFIIRVTQDNLTLSEPPYELNFHLVKVISAESTICKTSEPTSGKDFVK